MSTQDNYQVPNDSGRLLLNRMRPLRRKVASIKRQGLLARLEQQKDTHLSIIHAPAGYGKTALLAQYFEQLQTQNQHCGWLTLDSSDDDPVQFLAYLIASLDSTTLIPKDILDAAFNGFHGLEENETFNLIVNCLSGFQTPVYILLDDYHLLQTGPSQRCVQKLIELTFENTHFIITSREVPTALKGRLQVSGSYFELTASDLALTKKETIELLGLSKRINITDELIGLLHEKTEGWAAAIEFAKNWSNKNTEIDINSFINQSTDFSTFVMTEIFNRLSDDLQGLMVNTSIVSQFDGDIINVVCARNDGWQVLEKLFQLDLIIPLDEASVSYRYHHLLTVFLQNRFRKKHDNDKSDLHKLTSEWYLATDNHAESIRHAIACNDPEHLASVTERSGGWRFVLDGRISTLTSILELLPLETIQNYPKTYLGYIMLVAKHGNVSEASVEFNKFRDITHGFTILNGSPLPPFFAVEANVAEFFLDAIGDRPQTQQCIARMESALKGIDKKDHLLQANLLNYLSYGYFDYGSYEKAFNAGEGAIFHYKELRSIYGENFLYFHLGKICLAQGRLRDAEQLYDEGYQLAVNNFGIDSDMAAIAAAHLAEIAYEKSEFEQAQTYLSVALPRIEQSEAWFDVYISAYLTAANIARIQENAGAAMKVLIDAFRTGKRRKIHRLRIFSICQQARIFVREGRLQRVGWIINRLQFESFLNPTTENEFISHRVIEEIGLTTAYYFIQSERPLDAIKVIDSLLTTAKRNNCRRSLISLFILLSLAYFKLGKQKLALTRLNDAVSHAMFEGFKRPFLVYGEDQRVILELALSNNQLFPINRLKRSFLVELLNMIDQENRYRERHSPSLLTFSEREIVKYIYDGYSNKEIARSRNCSENTVKFHLKNIFLKFGVKNRKALARIAWEHIEGKN